ncbi:MAG: penicillin-binding transpeptidase domain-containing protein, partial [Oscillospiraceae bacterium]
QRFIAAFAMILLLMTLLTARLSLLMGADTLAQAADRQSAYLLDVADTRGELYDRALRPLTGASGSYLAAVLPNEQSADVLLRALQPEARAAVQKKLERRLPFVCSVPMRELYARGLEIFWVPTRYADDQPAVHLIGQCDAATGAGASGLERAYEQLLSSTGGSLKIRYHTDALGRATPERPPEILDSGYRTGAGLVLTLDRDIQQLAERASASIQKGAVVVMDPATGDLLGSVSRPLYNPNDMAAALDDPDSPFINRALYAYPVGSTFKTLTAAAALEQGYSTKRTFSCEGALEVGDQIFRCHKLAGHGTLNMTQAMEKSCNPYFISLALEVGGQSLLYKALQLGFGSACELAPGLRAMPGTLPTERELIAPAATANFGFGQGALTATPLQIATLISSIANNGGAVTPRLVAGTTTDGVSYASHTASYSPRSVFYPDAAAAVRR